jgi:hypothetical protein
MIALAEGGFPRPGSANIADFMNSTSELELPLGIINTDRENILIPFFFECACLGTSRFEACPLAGLIFFRYEHDAVARLLPKDLIEEDSKVLAP